jgi:hypothetical protein
MQRALQTYTRLALLMAAAILATPSVHAAAAPTATAATNAAAKKAGSKAGAAKGSDAKSVAEAKTNAAPLVVEIPKSTFASSTDSGGKDPFFPDTLRFQRVADSGNRTNKVAVAAPEIKVNGFTGNPAQPLVILNNVTFGIGDETTVPTPAGRVRVRCVEIRVAEQIAVVEINGVRRELKFAPRK